MSAPDSHRPLGSSLGGVDYITMTIAGQLFGLPVLSVQDVLGPQKIAKIPLAPPEIAGSLNLRGRIVTAVDMRKRLHLERRDDDENNMSIVVEHQGELYSLVIDQVGEVLNLPSERFEATPANLDSRWRDVSAGVFRLDESLLVVLEIDCVLNINHAAAA